MHFKSQIYRVLISLLYNRFVCLTACLPACPPAVRPGFIMGRAPVISHKKGNHVGFTKPLSEERLSTAPWCFLLSFIGQISSSNHLQKGE